MWRRHLRKLQGAAQAWVFSLQCIAAMQRDNSLIFCML
jgi:hypothetical protein